jgi:hypothetical protein
MRRVVIAVALTWAVGLLSASLSGAQAAVAYAPSQLAAAADSVSAVEKADFVFGGRNHCWYNRGWHGPGWYWCGYAWRRGHGWGGPRGWNNWVYSGWGPAPGVVVVAPGCRWVNQRVVRPNGVVVVRRVRVCR